jgi:nucleoside-diphosphate-sugar epimerase
MSKESVLLTGATGFIGSHLTEKLLLENHYQLVAIVRKTENYKNTITLKNKGVTLVEGSFFDKKILENIFQRFPIHYIIHAAALRGVGAGTKEDYYKVNVFGTEMLLKTSLINQVKKFIFCSTVGVYGTIPRELPANMKTKFNGDNYYHNSKIMAEKKVQEFIAKGLNAFIVRPPITYGKGDNGFPSTLVKLVKKRMLLLPGKDNKIHLLDVDNLADLFMKILKTNNLNHRVFIVADEAPIPLRELVNLIYSYYYKRNYPSFLRMPSFIFNLMQLILQMVKNEKWSARMQLMFKNWYYDTSETSSSIGFSTIDTKDGFLKFLHTVG